LPETLRLSAVYAAARTKFLLCVGSVFAILLLAFARGFVLLERICFTLSPCTATKFSVGHLRSLNLRLAFCGQYFIEFGFPF